jgi:hypothetical protein
MLLGTVASGQAIIVVDGMHAQDPGPAARPASLRTAWKRDRRRYNRAMSPKLNAIRVAWRATLVAAALAPLPAGAQVDCGNLIGARQTALRLHKDGWALPEAVRISLDRTAYRNITREERELVIRVVEEAYRAPAQTSEIVLEFCRAETARKDAEKSGGAPK